MGERDGIGALPEIGFYGLAGHAGTPRDLLGQFGAGADGVILHGVTPAEAEPVVTAYREVRQDGAAAAAGSAILNPGRG
ncbi:hypothetical protein ACQP1W_37855 [Spirillospora sp. CA-255316]